MESVNFILTLKGVTMFTSITSNLDLLIKIIGLILFLLVFSYMGLGFIFRTMFKIFKIKITNANLNKADNELLDLQLIKLYHGVTLDKISDIDIFSEAVSSGKITAISGWIFPSIRVIGKESLTKADSFFRNSLYVVLTALVLSFPLYILHGYKYNYAGFTEGNDHVLVSALHVYDPESNKYFDKESCHTINLYNKKVIKMACDYILTSDPEMKNTLSLAIQENNSSIIIVMAITVIMCLIVLGLSISYSRFRRINNEFYDFKRNKILE